MTGRPKGRRPGSSGAREQILQAARDTFAEVGYDRASMRLVASRAGVDPALIHHYFGTKEGLLGEALELPFDPHVVLAGITDDPDRAGFEIVRRVVGTAESSPAARTRLVGMLRTALAHESAAAMMRNVLATSVLRELERIVADETAPLRASLVGSHLAGLILGRYVLRIPALAEATVDQLAAAVGPAIQHYVNGPISTVP